MLKGWQLLLVDQMLGSIFISGFLKELKKNLSLSMCSDLST
jgi:hypothetical protein